MVHQEPICAIGWDRGGRSWPGDMDASMGGSCAPAGEESSILGRGRTGAQQGEVGEELGKVIELWARVIEEWWKERREFWSVDCSARRRRRAMGGGGEGGSRGG